MSIFDALDRADRGDARSTRVATLSRNGRIDVPAHVAIALMAIGAIGFDAAMRFEHAVMLPAMLLAMLLRIDEYATVHHEHAPMREAMA